MFEMIEKNIDQTDKLLLKSVWYTKSNTLVIDRLVPSCDLNTSQNRTETYKMNISSTMPHQDWSDQWFVF